MEDYRETEQYQRLAEAVHERLARIGLAEAARRGGAQLEEDGSLVMTSLGRSIRVLPESFQVEGAFNMWHELVLLQYLADGDGRQPMDRWMGLANFEDGGLVRGSSFDQEVRKIAAEHLSGRTELQLIKASRALGGEDDESMGDLTYNFLLAPHFPVQVLIWLADDEFSASAKVLVDGNAEHYLGVEAAGTVAVLLMQLLVQESAEQ